MSIDKQFSVFVQNKVGSLGDLCNALSTENVNIRAMSIVDDLEWGIVRLIVDDNEKTKMILQKLGLMFGESQILTVNLPNHPGSLAKLSEKLTKKKINIEHAYITAAGDSTLLVLSTTDDKKANSVLSR